MPRTIVYRAGGFTNCGIGYTRFSQEELAEMKDRAMTESEAIKFLKERIELINSDYPDVVDYKNALECAIRALEEVQQYREIGTPEECLRNKDFLDFLSDKMNPNDFETYLRLYNALEEKGCEE